VAPPLPAYDDEEYVEADPVPPPARVPNNRNTKGPPPVPIGNQNRPIPSLPRNVGSKMPAIPVVAVNNIVNVSVNSSIRLY